MGKWETKKLHEVADINMGQSPDSETYNFDGKGMPFFQGKTDFGMIYPTTRVYCTEPKKTAKQNDILISVRAPVGAVNIASETCCIGRGLSAISQGKSSYYKYIFYYLSYKQNDIAKLGVGSTFTAISKKDLDSIELPIPPLPIQQKIADVLDKASALIEMRKAQIEKLDLLVKSQFIEMFGDPVTNPKGWPAMSLKQASIRLSDGPFGSNLKSENYTSAGIRVIRLQNIGVGVFDDTDKAYVSLSYYEKLKKYTCEPGEIVIATLGDPNLRACIVPENIPNAINKADCVHYIPKPNLLNNEFVCQYINCRGTLDLAAGMIHGQTRTRISSGQLANIPIYIPPYVWQKRFSCFVKKINTQKLLISDSLSEMDLNISSLAQKCFSGEMF